MLVVQTDHILVDSVMPATEVANPIPCEQHGQCLRDVKTHSSADLHRRDMVDKCVRQSVAVEFWVSRLMSLPSAYEYTRASLLAASRG